MNISIDSEYEISGMQLKVVAVDDVNLKLKNLTTDAEIRFNKDQFIRAVKLGKVVKVKD